MTKQSSKNALFSGFDQISLLRKLTIVYFLASVLPVGLLYYVYWHIKNKGRFEITEQRFAVILMLVIGGVWIGYWVLRSMVAGVVRLASEQRRQLKLLLGEGFDSVALSQEGEYDELRVLEACFKESTRQLEQHIQHLQRTRSALRDVITRISQGLNHLDDINDFLELILMTLTEALDVKGALLLEHAPLSNKWSMVSAVGDAIVYKNWVPSGDHALIRAVMESNGPVRWVPHNANVPTAEWPRPILACGLWVHETCLGMIVLMGRPDERPFTDEDCELVRHIGLQTAVAMETAALKEDAERTYLETLTALALAVEAKEPYARGHGRRVADLCDAIAQQFDLREEDRRLLHEAALLHDIGKIGVSEALLNKQPPLTDDEMDLVKRHVIIGEGIVAPLKHSGPIGKIIRHHHERLDGSGYPDGLKGDQIPLTVRILTVADIYDALTSLRPERGPLTPHQAIARLREMSGQVDPQVVDALASVIEANPLG